MYVSSRVIILPPIIDEYYFLGSQVYKNTMY